MADLIYIELDNEMELTELLDKIDNNDIITYEIFSPYPLKNKYNINNQSFNIAHFSTIGGFIGIIGSLSFIYWLSEINYKLLLGAKPFFSFWYAIPFTLEITILLAGIFLFFSFLFATKLPKWYYDENADNLIEKSQDNIIVLKIKLNNSNYFIEKYNNYINFNNSEIIVSKF